VHDFSNLEFDWLACDADGFVALFSSAGFGPVPEESVAMADALDAAMSCRNLDAFGVARRRVRCDRSRNASAKATRTFRRSISRSPDQPIRGEP
jgi:hypothetical protein